jgi:hypothetical protein
MPQQAAFLAYVREVYPHLTFHEATDLHFSDDDDQVRHATPAGDQRPNKFWYIARERPFLQVRFGHYPTDGGTSRGKEWTPTPLPPMSDQARAELAAGDDKNRQAIRAEKQRQQGIRRAEVMQEWDAGEPPPGDFPYLERKGITGALPRELRLVQHRFKREGSTPFGKTEPSRGQKEPALMFPLHRLGSSDLVTAEYIAHDGEKDYAYGLPVKGACFIFGTFDVTQPIYLCEGIATAWTIHHLTQCMTVRCGSAGNLKAVAQDARQAFGPTARIVVCAERGNGHAQGVSAAAAVAGLVCTPPFHAGEEGSDFNDYWLAHGDEATQVALNSFSSPPFAEAAGSQTAAVTKWMEEVNSEYFVGMNWGGGTRIGRRSADGNFRRIDEGDMKLALANRRVPGCSKKPHLFWLEHPNRREYREVAYDPEGRRLDATRDLNLWTGWGVEPKAGGAWDLLRQHIQENIAGGNAAVAEHIIKLMAYVVQHPGRPCGVGLVLRGAQGCGKGTLFNALLKLFGRHGKSFNKAEQLTGSFTEHLEHVSFVFCDEVGWAGDHDFNDTLKSLITDPRLQIHPKGRMMYEVPNTLNFGFATNREHAFNLASGDRRMFVVEVRDAWADLSGAAKAEARDRYFGPLHAQLEAGGYSALLHDLLSMDLAGFAPAAFPRTQAATEQTEMSMDGLNRWIVRTLREGGWSFGAWVDGARVDKKLIYQSYVDSATAERERYIVKEPQFWKRLRDVTGDPWSHIESEAKDKETGERRRWRDMVLPPLDEVKKHASPRLGVEL